MKSFIKNQSGKAGMFIVFSIGVISFLAVFQTFFIDLNPGQGNISFSVAQAASSTVTASTTVIVGNASPIVTAVTLNNGGTITLTPNATTAISVAATITDYNGCTDITGGTSTILVYRSGITSSTCLTTANNQNCYIATTFTASSSCSAGTQNVTSTFGIYYFADSTNGASSSYSSQTWMATVIFKDPTNATGSADSSGVELNVLTALNVTTSSINYGTVPANTNTGSTNQLATSTNAGNSTTTLKISAISTLTNGSNSISTSSQHYATSSFTYGGVEQLLQETATDVSGSTMAIPTSTTDVTKTTYWGLAVPPATATGTYTGVNLFTSAWSSS